MMCNETASVVLLFVYESRLSEDSTLPRFTIPVLII